MVTNFQNDKEEKVDREKISCVDGQMLIAIKNILDFHVNILAWNCLPNTRANSSTAGTVAPQQMSTDYKNQE